MFFCVIFWLIAIPLVVGLWRPPRCDSFSWEERLVGTILLFLPVFGVVYWGVYFQRPPSKKPNEIFPGPNEPGVTGVGRVMWTEAEVARQNAAIPEGKIRVASDVRMVLRFLRWPFFLVLIGVVVWFNALLIR